MPTERPAAWSGVPLRQRQFRTFRDDLRSARRMSDMSQPIVYVDTSEVRAGRLDELKAAIAELTWFVEATEPRLLAYHVYFSDDGARMTVLHINPDLASLQFHMDVAGPLFRPIGEFITTFSIEVYGQPGETLVEHLRPKAEMLGGGSVRVHDLHTGFDRLPRG